MTPTPRLAPSTDPLVSDPVPDASGIPDIPLVGPWWTAAETLLVADRKPGSTHKFFHDWRIEVVADAVQVASGRALLTIPISQQALVESGWQYRMLRHGPRPGFQTIDTATFSWVAYTKGATPDPIAAAINQARAWLAAAADSIPGGADTGAAHELGPRHLGRPLRPGPTLRGPTPKHREEQSDG